MLTKSKGRRRFRLLLVKPTHYCDDGYPITWLRSPVPSNSLACLYGIAQEFAEQKVLGEDVEIEIHAFDEANTRIRPKKLAALIKRAPSCGIDGYRRCLLR